MAFENFIYILTSWGVAEFLLPFLLVFVIVYATLHKTKILGEEKKNLNVVLALIMGLAVVIPHFTGWYSTWDPVVVINQALPQVSIILVAIIMLLLIIGVFGNEIEIANTPLSGWIVIVAIITVVAIFGSAVGWFRMPIWLGFLQDPELQALIVMVLVFGIIIWFITKEPKEKKETKEAGKFLKDYFGSIVKEKRSK
ncbi:hypothetical protein KY348_03860 [Candidatus Woesearchaeota archaeon]|nr:hypothetical protein [Candidatus Woesearchaeota archaeon]